MPHFLRCDLLVDLEGNWKLVDNWEPNLKTRSNRSQMNAVNFLGSVTDVKRLCRRERKLPRRVCKELFNVSYLDSSYKGKTTTKNKWKVWDLLENWIKNTLRYTVLWTENQSKLIPTASRKDLHNWHRNEIIEKRDSWISLAYISVYKTNHVRGLRTNTATWAI